MDPPILNATVRGSVAYLVLARASLGPGEVDGLHAALWDAWSQATTERVVVDFGEVNYLSSLVLGVLLEFSQFVSGEGGTVRLAGMKAKVRAIFEVSELDRVLDVRDDPQTAFE